jgi:hypothetical protein
MNLKHYLLIWLTRPDQANSPKWQLWLRFLHTTLLQTEPPKGIQRLAENVWLIPRDSGVKFLVSLGHEAEQHELVYQARFLTSDDT